MLDGRAGKDFLAEKAGTNKRGGVTLRRSSEVNEKFRKFRTLELSSHGRNLRNLESVSNGFVLYV